MQIPSGIKSVDDSYTADSRQTEAAKFVIYHFRVNYDRDNL